MLVNITLEQLHRLSATTISEETYGEDLISVFTYSILHLDCHSQRPSCLWLHPMNTWGLLSMGARGHKHQTCHVLSASLNSFFWPIGAHYPAVASVVASLVQIKGTNRHSLLTG